MRKSDRVIELHLPDYKYQALKTFENPMYHHKHGLMYTSTGYGRKIPTEYMVKHNNRLKRVYCCIFSNSGTLFIMSGKKELIVSEG